MKRTVILDLFQPHGRWFSEIGKKYISRFPCVLDLLNAHQKYLKLSPVTGQCCKISFRSMSNSSDWISSKEVAALDRERKMKKQ